MINKNILKMQRASRMRELNEKRLVPQTKKFGGVLYRLAHVNIYKEQAEHYANAVRSKGGFARVVPGSGMAGGRKVHNCWRVYERMLIGKGGK